MTCSIIKAEDVACVPYEISSAAEGYVGPMKWRRRSLRRWGISNARLVVKLIQTIDSLILHGLRIHLPQVLLVLDGTTGLNMLNQVRKTITWMPLFRVVPFVAAIVCWLWCIATRALSYFAFVISWYKNAFCVLHLFRISLLLNAFAGRGL